MSTQTATERAQSTGDYPLVSCLCVTENRAAFMPWLLRAYDSQTYPHKELVIVDSSATPVAFPGRADIRVVAMPPGTWIPVKRNRAVELARGAIVAWFDDDDWQHPERLQQLVPRLRAGATHVGPNTGWFIDVFSLGCARFASPIALFNGSLYWRDVASSVRFDERMRKGSDTRYLRELAAKHGSAKTVRMTAFAWLCHEQNISNPRWIRATRREMAELRAMVGGTAWGDTLEALEMLRFRLGPPRRVQRRVAPKLTATASTQLPEDQIRSVVPRRWGSGSTMASRRQVRSWMKPRGAVNGPS